MAQPTFSETHGRRRGLTADGLVKMLYPALKQLLDEFVFAWAFGDPTASATFHDDGTIELGHGGDRDPEQYFLATVRSAEPWWYLLDPRSEEVRRRPPRSTDEVLDFVQALHRVASLETMEEDEQTPETVRSGQARMRELVNPVLGLLEPALQISADGSIVQVTPRALEPLVDHPLPDEVAADDIAQAVRDAIAQFRRRDASRADQHSACVRLAGVLEHLRDSRATTAALLSSDEKRLFEIANQFAFRHNDAAQRRDYDQDVFNEWVFYSQLSAIRLAARLRARR